jgi:hypothetical protein
MPGRLAGGAAGFLRGRGAGAFRHRAFVRRFIGVLAEPSAPQSVG